MPIRFHCADCRTKIKVPEGAEGRKVKCPRCGAVHRVPAQEVVVAQERGGVDSGVNLEPDLDSLASAVSDMSSPDDAPATEQAGSDDQVDEEPFDQEFPDETDLTELPEDQADHQNIQELEQVDPAQDDPLAALACMAQSDEPAETDLEDDQPQEDAVENLFDEPEPEPRATPKQASSPLSAATAAASAAAKPMSAIPVARPKPQPVARTAPRMVADATQSESQPASQRPTSPQPKAIPLSSRPAGSRVRATPIPLGDPTATRTPIAAAPSAPSNVLLLLGWLLRAMAILTTGGAVKLVLVASDSSWSFGECLLVLLYGLTVTVVVWALAEITLVVHATTLNRQAP